MADNPQASSATAAPVTTPPPTQTAQPVAPANEPSARNLNNPTGKVEQPATTQTAPAATEPPKEPEKQPEQSAKPKRGSGDFLAKMEAERKFREQERAAKNALAELNKQRAEFEALRKGAGDPRTDPIGYLEKQGVAFDELVKQITAREPPKVEDKVSALEKRLEEMRAEQESRLKQMQAEQMAADRAEWERQTVSYVRNNADKHELVTAFGAEGYVPQIISEYAQDYNKVLDVDEAARMTQEHLESVIEKVAATKWFKSKYQQIATQSNTQTAAPAASPAKVVEPGKQTADAKTLTSSATATATAVEQAKKPLSEAEARAKAIEILEAHMNRAKKA